MTRDDITLREARPDDALVIGVLAMQVFLNTYVPDGISPLIAREVLETMAPPSIARALADPAHRVVLAEREDRLVGFAQLQQGAAHELLADAPPAAELVRLYVQRPFLGHGLGRRLLNAAEGAARERGAALMWLTAWSGNQRARTFYRRQGYADVGTTWHVFEDQRHENRLFTRHLDGR